jgi:hypothetical protein
MMQEIEAGQVKAFAALADMTGIRRDCRQAIVSVIFTASHIKAAEELHPLYTRTIAGAPTQGIKLSNTCGGDFHIHTCRDIHPQMRNAFFSDSSFHLSATMPGRRVNRTKNENGQKNCDCFGGHISLFSVTLYSSFTSYYRINVTSPLKVFNEPSLSSTWIR